MRYRDLIIQQLILTENLLDALNDCATELERIGSACEYYRDVWDDTGGQQGASHAFGMVADWVDEYRRG